MTKFDILQHQDQSGDDRDEGHNDRSSRRSDTSSEVDIRVSWVSSSERNQSRESDCVSSLDHLVVCPSRSLLHSLVDQVNYLDRAHTGSLVSVLGNRSSFSHCVDKIHHVNELSLVTVAHITITICAHNIASSIHLSFHRAILEVD